MKRLRCITLHGQRSDEGRPPYTLDRDLLLHLVGGVRRPLMVTWIGVELANESCSCGVHTGFSIELPTNVSTVSLLQFCYTSDE